jgi:predicted AlkP superfamily pyrophosphatase or phosphodiesterase
LIPSFPTKTFPNHYTIATGLRPEHHGIVDNSFYNPDKNDTYKINNRELVIDGSWYGGTPLWVLAEQNGMKAASYFFVGSEADVQGVRPSYYYDYDGRVNNLTRVSKVFEWLQMPDSIRPRMITMYFSDMDDVGHGYGATNDAKLSQRLEQLDRELGALFEGVKSLDRDVNIIIVSDHGMADVSLENYISLDGITQDVSGKVVNSGALAHIYLDDPKEKAKVIEEIRKKAVGFKVFDPVDGEYYKDVSVYGDRIGDVIVLADLGHYFIDNEEYREVVSRRMRIDGTSVRGTHGYSQEYPEMHGIFYAQGPQIKSGMGIESFDNIHIYPLICKILGLPIPEEIDGKLEVLEKILKD